VASSSPPLSLVVLVDSGCRGRRLRPAPLAARAANDPAYRADRPYTARQRTARGTSAILKTIARLSSCDGAETGCCGTCPCTGRALSPV
jgi:hypothetical protein